MNRIALVVFAIAGICAPVALPAPSPLPISAEEPRSPYPEVPAQPSTGSPGMPGGSETRGSIGTDGRGGLAAEETAPAEPRARITVVGSWYGPGFYGNRTACGQIYDDAIVGVAHKTLPCGSIVTLTHGGRTFRIPVIDRGPFVPGREFDLSSAARRAFDCPDLCRMEWDR